MTETPGFDPADGDALRARAEEVSPPQPGQELDPRLVAAVDMIRRCGAQQVTFGFADDVKPPLWWAWAEFHTDAAGRPRGDGKERRHEAAGAMNPLRALLRLAETIVDGSLCRHCGRPAGLDPDEIESMPAERAICWYLYDPELRTFRRGCEGDTVAKLAVHSSPYTRHGHLVPGYSTEGWPEPDAVARCGGVVICGRCATDAERIRRREG